MISRVLHGPPQVEIQGQIMLRPLVLDKTTVVRIAETMTGKGHGGSYQLFDWSSLTTRSVSEHFVSAATSYELRDLRIEGDGVVVDLGRERSPSISFPPELSGLAHEIAELMISNGRPRFQWRRRILPMLVPLVIALAGAAFVWWIAADSQSAAAATLTGLLVIGASASFYDLGQRFIPFRSPSQPSGMSVGIPVFHGHLVSESTRAQWLENRWTTRRDLKVGLPAAVISGALGAVLTLLFGK